MIISFNHKWFFTFPYLPAKREERKQWPLIAKIYVYLSTLAQLALCSLLLLIVLNNTAQVPLLEKIAGILFCLCALVILCDFTIDMTHHKTLNICTVGVFIAFILLCLYFFDIYP